MELDPNEVGLLAEKDQANCAVTPWGPWSECSSSCGPGFEVRSRRFEDRMGAKRCPFVELTERRKCSLPACVDTVPVSTSGAWPVRHPRAQAARMSSAVCWAAYSGAVRRVRAPSCLGVQS